MDRTANVVLDIEGLPQPPDKCCSGSPKMTRALSRKGSNRIERRGGEEQEQEDLGKKLIIKVDFSGSKIKIIAILPADIEHLSSLHPASSDWQLIYFLFVPSQLEQPLVQNKTLAAPSTPVFVDSVEGRNKRSSLGTTILIYFTLAINSKAEA
ncbi:hypothetical protein EJB05_40093 [Eragrostis curvula]|uniref:Uncharacterized protein n=1 Tax=Eragrostis curvula TaxID=38414 RepID=A0A5J9TYQ8_9POAL|nr:hypothetical protein EJB05_40093 [Eragrostis curvula]